MEEDETICDWLVDSMDMKSISLSIHPNWGIVSTQSTNTKAAGYRFYPNLVKGEGFFLAVFQKLASTENKRYKANAIQMASKTEQQQIIDTIPLMPGLSFFNQSGAIRAIPEEWMTDIGILASQLYIKKAGIELASLKGKDVLPSHELALSPILLAGYPVIELPLNDALQYLRRKEFVFSGIIGWNLVQFGGLSLGWVKVLPNRINNYYPAASQPASSSFLRSSNSFLLASNNIFIFFLASSGSTSKLGTFTSVSAVALKVFFIALGEVVSSLGA
jgi:NOL1/NOP2/fmu family ribosome biogenesis protein